MRVATKEEAVPGRKGPQPLGRSLAGLVRHQNPRSTVVTNRAFLIAAHAWALCLLVSSCLYAQQANLRAYPEFLRTDPFGQIVKADRAADATQAPGQRPRSIALEGARGGYVSFHLVAELPRGGDYALEFTLAPGYGGIQLDLYREWFHYLDKDQSYYPDALIPIAMPYSSRLPEPDNRIKGQTAQAFWVDVWIPESARPGLYRGRAILRAGTRSSTLPVELKVLPAVVPEQDVVTIDHNSYGSNWLADQYPGLARGRSDFYTSDAFFHLIQAYHRIFYEHRGIFHQLGYGHAGKVGPEFAPALAGEGKRRHIANWDLYDRHYGPLFDGSAFAGTRRGARPIPFVYLPINPEWPASFVNWGEPGYEVEFVNVVSEMERHFREKRWTHTRFEVFFNHKKRYMGFPWDGNEVRFAKDNQYFIEYARLLKKALPPDTPVRFVMRADVSWDMEQQFRELRGMVTMWVAAGDILSWYRDAPRMLHERGDIVWYYGGPPSVNEPSATITRFPLQAWLWGVDGFVHWLTVDPGEDPWFHFNGGGTALVYPGDRFGIEAPIPSIRLKIQRNCLQDVALLDSLKNRGSLETLKAEVARRFNNSTLDAWWNPRPALADLPPSEWSGTSIDEASTRTTKMLAVISPTAWSNVHEYVLQVVSEVQ